MTASTARLPVRRRAQTVWRPPGTSPTRRGRSSSSRVPSRQWPRRQQLVKRLQLARSTDRLARSLALPVGISAAGHRGHGRRAVRHYRGLHRPRYGSEQRSGARGACARSGGGPRPGRGLGRQRPSPARVALAVRQGDRWLTRFDPWDRSDRHVTTVKHGQRWTSPRFGAMSACCARLPIPPGSVRW